MFAAWPSLRWREKLCPDAELSAVDLEGFRSVKERDQLRILSRVAHAPIHAAVAAQRSAS